MCFLQGLRFSKFAQIPFFPWPHRHWDIAILFIKMNPFPPRALVAHTGLFLRLLPDDGDRRKSPTFVGLNSIDILLFRPIGASFIGTDLPIPFSIYGSVTVRIFPALCYSCPFGPDNFRAALLLPHGCVLALLKVQM